VKLDYRNLQQCGETPPPYQPDLTSFYCFDNDPLERVLIDEYGEAEDCHVNFDQDQADDTFDLTYFVAEDFEPAIAMQDIYLLDDEEEIEINPYHTITQEDDSYEWINVIDDNSEWEEEDVDEPAKSLDDLLKV
jgi:hypothetical protein